MANPPQLLRSDGRHERLLCCSPIDFDVGDSIKSLDAKYYAITARGKGVDAAFITWAYNPALTAICKYRNHSGLEDVDFKLDWNVAGLPDSFKFPKGGPGQRFSMLDVDDRR